MLEQNVVVTSLEVYHVGPLGVPQRHVVVPSVVQLIVILIRLLVDRRNVLADPVGLSRLHPWYQQQQSCALGLLIC